MTRSCRKIDETCHCCRVCTFVDVLAVHPVLASIVKGLFARVLFAGVEATLLSEVVLDVGALEKGLVRQRRLRALRRSRVEGAAFVVPRAERATVHKADRKRLGLD